VPLVHAQKSRKQSKPEDGCDQNANPVSVKKVVESSKSTAWLEDALSKCVTDGATVDHSKSAANYSSSATTTPVLWNERNVSKSMASVRKKVTDGGSLFYVEVDEKSKTQRSQSKDQRTNVGVPPPIPPRDYGRNSEMIGPAFSSFSQSLYSNLSDILLDENSAQPNAVASPRRIPEVVQTSCDIYQNFMEFSAGGVGQSNAGGGGVVCANSNEQRRHSTTSSGGERRQQRGSVVDGADDAKVERIRRHVTAASRDECLAALAACRGDVTSAIHDLKVEQLFRLGIASRDRCRELLENCSWNLESAGSVLLNELSTGSPV
jgi:hypothetical protein